MRGLELESGGNLNLKLGELAPLFDSRFGRMEATSCQSFNIQCRAAGDRVARRGGGSDSGRLDAAENTTLSQSVLA